MNKAPRMRGGITVAGLVTGSHMIEDIKVSVPHQTAVFIPADLAYKSKDLWRGIGQRRLFQLTGGSGLAVEPNIRAQPANTAELEDLRAENKKLRKQLGETQQQNVGLQEAIQAMQGQLSAILRVLGKIETNGVLAVLPPQVQKDVKQAVGAVGGDVPTFIPNDLKAEDADVSITVESESVERTSVLDAAKTLRAVRKKG